LEIILIAILIIAVLAFIAYPLFNTTRAPIAATSNEMDTLVAQRDAAYDAIRDLDLDFQMGKLSQDDYAPLRDKYRARAAQILQQIDAAGGTDTDAQIEQQVAKLRRAKTESVEDEIARMRAQRNATRGAVLCSQCGTRAQPNDRFCAKCGNRI